MSSQCASSPGSRARGRASTPDSHAQSRATAMLAGLFTLCLTGCADDPSVEVPEPTMQQPSASGRGDAEVVASCDQAVDGTTCGELGMHCVFNACVANACGDGLMAEREECDDGDEIEGDGCNSRCKIERCGNGVLDLGEECDDANSDEADACSASCNAVLSDGGQKADSGSGADAETLNDAGADGGADAAVQDAGFADGSVLDATVADAGVADGGASDGGASDASPGDGGSAEAGGQHDAGPDLCQTCVTAPDSPCRTFQDVGVDFPAKCLENPDPAFAQSCTDAYECSIQDPGLCAGDLTRGAISCYCGLEQTLDDCFAPSSATKGPKGPCIARWETAAGCAAGDFACVSDNFANTEKPSAFASFLLNCTVSALDCGPSCPLPRPKK